MGDFPCQRGEGSVDGGGGGGGGWRQASALGLDAVRDSNNGGIDHPAERCFYCKENLHDCIQALLPKCHVLHTQHTGLTELFPAYFTWSVHVCMNMTCIEAVVCGVVAGLNCCRWNRDFYSYFIWCKLFETPSRRLQSIITLLQCNCFMQTSTVCSVLQNDVCMMYFFSVEKKPN